MAVGRGPSRAVPPAIRTKSFLLRVYYGLHGYEVYPLQQKLMCFFSLWKNTT